MQQKILWYFKGNKITQPQMQISRLVLLLKCQCVCIQLFPHCEAKGVAGKTPATFNEFKPVLYLK